MAAKGNRVPVETLSSEQAKLARLVEFLKPMIRRELPESNKVRQAFEKITGKSTGYQIAAAYTAFNKLPAKLMSKVLCGWTWPTTQQRDLIEHEMPALKIEFRETASGHEGSLVYGIVDTHGAGVTISIAAGTSQTDAQQILEAVLYQVKHNWGGLPGQQGQAPLGLRIKKSGDRETQDGATFDGNTSKSKAAAA